MPDLVPECQLEDSFGNAFLDGPDDPSPPPTPPPPTPPEGLTRRQRLQLINDTLEEAMQMSSNPATREETQVIQELVRNVELILAALNSIPPQVPDSF